MKQKNRFLGKIQHFAKNHKIAFTMILILVLGVIWYAWKKTNTNTTTKYVLASVKKGTLVVSVSGSGTVSTENQIDLKAKASGQIVKLPVYAGSKVKKGDLIAQIDARDALIALQSAQITLNKLLEPADKLSITQAQGNLSQSYSDGFNNVARAFVDLPVVMQGLYDLLYKQGGYLTEQYVDHQSDTVKTLRQQANSSFGISRTMLDNLTIQYNSTSKSNSSTVQIESLINNTYDTIKNISQLVKDAKNTVDQLQTERNEQGASIATTAQGNLSSWTDKINTDLNSVLGSKNSIANNKEALRKLQDGPDKLDIQSAQLSLQQKQNAYNDYFLTAPFDGIVARVPAHLLDNISSGVVVATLITPQQYADITLNEVDVVKVKPGQKATMTFDAVDGLTLTGEVDQVDSVGTSNQGVVTYGVKIKLDDTDSRVRSGMSVSASIVTDVRSNALLVPSGAVRTSGGIIQVQVVKGVNSSDITNQGGVELTTPPTPTQVEIGLTNDTDTEILSGLNVGQFVVVRTINTTTTAKSASGFNFPGTTNNRSTNSAVRAISH